jgi:Sec-independent protein translocase protein TatA
MGLKEVIVVGVVILLLFGGSILPRLARSSAKRMKESKDTLIATKSELEAGLRDLHNDDAATPATPEQVTPTNRTPSR